MRLINSLCLFIIFLVMTIWPIREAKSFSTFDLFTGKKSFSDFCGKGESFQLQKEEKDSTELTKNIDCRNDGSCRNTSVATPVAGNDGIKTSDLITSASQSSFINPCMLFFLNLSNVVLSIANEILMLYTASDTNCMYPPKFGDYRLYHDIFMLLFEVGVYFIFKEVLVAKIKSLENQHSEKKYEDYFENIKDVYNFQIAVNALYIVPTLTSMGLDTYSLYWIYNNWSNIGSCMAGAPPQASNAKGVCAAVFSILTFGPFAFFNHDYDYDRGQSASQFNTDTGDIAYFINKAFATVGPTFWAKVCPLLVEKRNGQASVAANSASNVSSEAQEAAAGAKTTAEAQATGSAKVPPKVVYWVVALTSVRLAIQAAYVSYYLSLMAAYGHRITMMNNLLKDLKEKAPGSNPNMQYDQKMQGVDSHASPGSWAEKILKSLSLYSKKYLQGVMPTGDGLVMNEAIASIASGPPNSPPYGQAVMCTASGNIYDCKECLKKGNCQQMGTMSLIQMMANEKGGRALLASPIFKSVMDRIYSLDPMKDPPAEIVKVAGDLLVVADEIVSKFGSDKNFMSTVPSRDSKMFERILKTNLALDFNSFNAAMGKTNWERGAAVASLGPLNPQTEEMKRINDIIGNSLESTIKEVGGRSMAEIAPVSSSTAPANDEITNKVIGNEHNYKIESINGQGDDDLFKMISLRYQKLFFDGRLEKQK